MNNGFGGNVFNGRMAPEQFQQYDQDQLSENGSCTQPFDGYGYEDVEGSETASNCQAQYFEGDLVQEEQYYDCADASPNTDENSNQANEITTVNIDDSDETDDEENWVNLDDSLDSDNEEFAFTGNIEQVLRNSPEIVAFVKQLRELQNEFNAAEQEDKKLTAELAEQQALLAAEIQELAGIQSNLEEIESEIRKQSIPTDVGQKFIEVEYYIQSVTQVIEEMNDIMTHIDEGNVEILESDKKHEVLLTSYDNDSKNVSDNFNKVIETLSRKMQELTASRKAAEARFAAEINDYDLDIKSMRNTICETEKMITDHHAELECLKNEIMKTSLQQEESLKKLESAKEKFQVLKGQTDGLPSHTENEAEQLRNEQKSLKEERTSLLLARNCYYSGLSMEHEELKEETDAMNEVLNQRAAARQRAIASQQRSEKNFDYIMTKSEELNKRLRDSMDKLNDIRQKMFSERLDFDYTINKTQLDFAKISASNDEKLKTLMMVVNELKKEAEEIAGLKQKADGLRKELENRKESQNRKDTKSTY